MPVEFLNPELWIIVDNKLLNGFLDYLEAMFGVNL